MKVYRIGTSQYIRDLSGTGAKLFGGRWNPKGKALLYTAEYKSLAALELLVHLDRKMMPDDLKLISLSIPNEEIEKFGEEKFTKILKSKDSTQKFKEAGRLWLESKKSLGLKVSSVLISGENNILINPAHKAFSKIEILHLEDFIFDKRFFS